MFCVGLFTVISSPCHYWKSLLPPTSPISTTFVLRAVSESTGWLTHLAIKENCGHCYACGFGNWHWVSAKKGCRNHVRNNGATHHRALPKKKTAYQYILSPDKLQSSQQLEHQTKFRIVVTQIIHHPNGFSFTPQKKKLQFYPAQCSSRHQR